MSDIFNGGENIIGFNDDTSLSCNYYYYNSETRTYELLTQGTQKEVPKARLVAFINALISGTSSVSNPYIEETPLWTLTDGTTLHQYGYKDSSNRIFWYLTWYNGEEYVQTQGFMNFGIYTSGGTLAYNILNGDLTYYFGFNYTTANTTTRSAIAVEDYFTLTELSVHDYNMTSSGHFYNAGARADLTENAPIEQMWIDIIEYNPYTPDPEDPDTGENGPGDGGNGPHQYTPQSADFPEDDTCNILDTGMFTLYQLESKQSVKALANILWSSDFVNQLLNLQKAPIDNIIALYCLPFGVSGAYTDDVKIGNYQTTINAHKITNQYHYYNFGDLAIPYFNQDQFDYYGTAQLYLPYIGWVDIALDNIRGGTVNLKYRYDVSNGNIMAFVKCKVENKYRAKGNSDKWETYTHNSIDYVFEGNCATMLPLTSVDHTQQWASMLTGTIGAIGGAATGNYIGAVSSVAGGAMGAMTPSYKRSGNLTSSMGNLGLKTPMILIMDPTPYCPSNLKDNLGFSANKYVTTNKLSGYQRFTWVDLNSLPILDEEEKDQLLSILQGGVFI